MVCEMILQIVMSFSLRRLNPCFNGRWSARKAEDERRGAPRPSLNPCFNGRWSARTNKLGECHSPVVLILVLMEDGLREF